MAFDFRNNQNNAPGSMPPPNGAGNNGMGGHGNNGMPNAITPKQAQQDASGVTEMLINYNKKFATSSPAKYRDKEIFSVISHLMMNQKSCSLLIGAPGTGKTKLVEEIARLIATQSPYTNTLNDYTVYELPLSCLMAGTSYRGQLEEKVKNIIEFCQSNKVILFIDEIHQLIGSGNNENGIAQMLKPAMARGEIKVIGATTLQEAKSLMNDPAFNRRFNTTTVCELSTEQTKEIIETVYMPKFSSFYGIGFGKNVAETVVKSAEKSKTIKCHRPDNAITLLDQVCANTLLQRNFNIATCTDENMRTTMQSTPVVVTMTHIESYNKDQNFTIPVNFDCIKDEFFYRDHIIDKLYNTISDYVKINNIFPDKKPFIIDITGDACSGRTSVALNVAKLIDEQPIYIDLSDYTDKTSLARIIGAPAGYVGYDSKKEMPFDIVESNPRKIIVLDNIDKAHHTVQEFFKSSIDTGLIKYADNKVVDITRTIIFKISMKAGNGANVGFTKAPKKESVTSISIDKLTNTELLSGTELVTRKMISELKAGHTKYNNIPEMVDMTDEDKNSIVTADDMQKVARRLVLSVI